MSKVLSLSVIYSYFILSCGTFYLSDYQRLSELLRSLKILSLRLSSATLLTFGIFGSCVITTVSLESL